MKVKEYLRRKKAIYETTFRVYPDGRKVYLLPSGEEIPEKELKAANELPITLNLSYSKENSNKKGDWMRVE